MRQIFWEKIFNNFKNEFKVKQSPNEMEKKYFQKTEKYINFIKWIPWIKMIWVWNSLSYFWTNSESDIDLYIVTDKNAMWFVRILITFIFQILWVRKNEKNHKERFCLSFFSTIDWMDFSNFKIENDIYLYFWIVYFKPILNYNWTYKKFLEKNNSWANFNDYEAIFKENEKFIKFSKQKTFFNENFIIWFFDKILKKIFLPKTLKHFKKIWKPYWVVINDDLLKFHNWDLRKEISKKLNIFY